MDGYNFTEDVRRALSTARLEAHRLGSPQLAPEHILLVLLGGKRNLAHQLLEHIQFNPATLASDLEKRLSHEPPTDPRRDLPFSRSAKRALEQAMREAIAFGHSAVETDHLLLAISAAPGPARTVLRAHGISVDSLRSQIQIVRGSADRHSLLKRFLLRLFRRTRLSNRARADLNRSVDA